MSTASAMNSTTLGMTQLQVSRLAFGAWQIGGDWGHFDDEQAIGAITKARELGINVFDTAQAYGFGASERLLGRALADDLRADREGIVIATKGGLRMTPDGMVRDASREWIRTGVEASLDALGVDYIDLYQVHWADPNVTFAETAEALQELVDEGKIRHVGVSNFTVEQMAEFARTRPVETLQPPYHLFRRDIETDVLPYTREHDIGVLVYGPLAHGLLSGAIDEHSTFAPDDWRSHSPVFERDTLRHNIGTVRALERFARERGYSIAQLAIAWTLAQPGVDVAIVGSRDATHIEHSLGALDVRLTADDLAGIDEIMVGAVPVGGPTPEAV